MRECRLVGCMPGRTDHRLVVVEMSPGGGGGGARHGWGFFPPAHQQVPKHQWERFARDHETWSSMWEPHADLTLQDWVERALLILCEAVGPPLGTTDIQLHKDVWTTLMARKRRWAARQGFDREAD